MSAEQDLANANVQIANLISEVTRFRDAAMGLNAAYPTITEGRQNTADGKYFSVPGNGAYMRLYRRQGSSASLIAEFPDRDELNGVIDQLGPLLGRDVTAGLSSFGSDSSLVRLRDIVYASRAYFGSYFSGSSALGNVDLAKAGECALYSSSNEGVFPSLGTNFFWIETQSTYSGESLFQTATNYAAGSPNIARQWIRVCANTLDTNGERQWGPWGEIYTSQNILGTVSQSNGIPTGAIIERGSNANGEYVKYADGTLFCSNLLTVTVQRESMSSTGWTTPAPSVTPIRYQATVNASDPVFWTISFGTGGSVFVSNSSSSARDIGVFVFAYGHWY